MEKKVVFIINPKAGVKKKMDIPAFIKEHFSSEINYDIIIWNNKDDFKNIQQQILNGNYTIAVAVGGDGTVNQIAQTVNHTNIALGILPFGSGNGLARSIGVPMDIKGALGLIAKGKTKKIDSGLINKVPFFCTSGVGFDAHIGALFASNTKRGLKSYIKIIWKEYFSYKAQDYKLIVDGKEENVNAFLIAFANAGQYGNNFYIAPQAAMNDGIIDISVLKPFALPSAIGLLRKILARKANLSKHIQSFSGKEIKLIRKEAGPFHFDGEPGITGAEVIVTVVPNSLNVISNS